MNTNSDFAGSVIRVPRARSLNPLLAIMCLALAGLSGYCLVLPFLKDILVPLNYAYMGVGAVGSVYFIFKFFDLTYQSFRPRNAVLISDEGFFDLVNAGNGAGLVPWSNVRRVDMYGNEKPYIGITLVDTADIAEGASHALRKQLAERSDAGKPELYFASRAVGIPLEKLYDLLRNARNAYMRTIDAGDTNVFIGEPAAVMKNNRIESFVEEPVSEETAPREEAPRFEKVVKADEPVSVTAPEVKPEVKPEKEIHSVDELLAELSATIGKRSEKTGLAADDIGAELKQFIDALNKKETKEIAPTNDTNKK